MKLAASMSDLPDEALLRNWLAGDEVAFEALFQRYCAPIFSYLCRLGAAGSLAEDLMQETFLKALAGAESFDPGRKFSTWLYVIATNAWRDYRKRTRRRLAWTALLGQSSGGVPPQDEALASLLQREAAAHVEEALRALPEEARAVLVMKHFQGLRYDDIAEVFGCPVGTVKSRVHAAVLQVRGRLAQKGLLPGEGP